MLVDLYEMNYSVSPGGVDCWEMDIRTGIGHSSNVSDFKTAGEAVNYLLDKYPDTTIELTLKSLKAYEKETNVISRK